MKLAYLNIQCLYLCKNPQDEGICVGKAERKIGQFQMSAPLCLVNPFSKVVKNYKFTFTFMTRFFLIFNLQIMLDLSGTNSRM